MQLLPPPPGTCPICAVQHDVRNPHDAESLYYKYRFYEARGRWPTWADAVAHCPSDVRALWSHELDRRGLWTEPAEGVGPPIADPPAESIRQAVGDPGSGSFGPGRPIVTTYRINHEGDDPTIVDGD